MTDIFRVGILGISVSLFAMQFKGLKSEYGIYMTITAALIIFYISFEKISSVINGINQIRQYLNVGDYMPIMIKIVGISYITELSSDICKDAGYGTIGNQIQLLGKLTILAVSMPVFETLFNTVSGLLS